MVVSLSIKNVPGPLVEKLRARAKDNHRSLQGELLVILEEALQQRRLSADEVHRVVVASGLQTPAESLEIIRAERDAR
jgi:plasmid stability protein